MKASHQWPIKFHQKDSKAESVAMSWRLHALPWWRHQMESFSALLALCTGNSLVPVNSPHKGQWRGPLMFSLICAWINDWVNNPKAGDLRRYRGHYDVNVMTSWCCGALGKTAMPLYSAIHEILFQSIRLHLSFGWFQRWDSSITHARVKYMVESVGWRPFARNVIEWGSRTNL